MFPDRLYHEGKDIALRIFYRRFFSFGDFPTRLPQLLLDFFLIVGKWTLQFL